MRVAVVLVHGIGDQGLDWADAIMSALASAVSAQLAGLGLGPVTADEALVLSRAHWAAALQARQRALGELPAGAAPVESRGAWWRRLWDTARRELQRQQTRFITEFIGDVIGYRDPAAREQIYAAIRDALGQTAAQASAAPAPLTLIAHSLGTVISSDFVWDETQARLAQDARGFHPRLRLENFFTVGSPLALFALQYGGPEAFTKPIRMESPAGRWVNIYDPDDPVAMPLTTLNAAYAQAVLRDALVEAGPYLLAHLRYFTRPETLTIISRKLALDWAAHHQRLTPARLAELYAAYDRTLGLAG